MPRLTAPLPDGSYTVAPAAVTQTPAGCTGQAIARLAAFENAFEALLASQQQAAAELDSLRGQGKAKTVKFRELLAKKIIQGNLIALFELHGLEPR